MRTAWRLLLAAACLLGSAQALAQRPPATTPATGVITTDIVRTFDRSAPEALELWAPRTVLGYGEVELGYGKIHLTCGEDERFGNCPVRDTWEGPSGPRPVQLGFREERSGQITTVAISGWLERAEWERYCSSDYWDYGRFPLWSSRANDCLFPPGGTAAGLIALAEDVQNLVAGRWTAELRLNLRIDPDGPIIATHVFRFDLTITDRDRTMIYLPEFGMAEPLVGLQLDYRPIPSPGTIGGTAVLDMCLYDGMGSQSEYLAITARDMGPAAPGRPPSQYSVWHRDGGREAQDRLDYQLTLDHSGQKIALHNNEEVLLRGIDTAELRLVMLPDMNQWVYCVPTPLTLETPRVPASEKREGYYDGRLKLEMRLPTDRL
ncbi:CfaE/CblD family pilus tip adhesin [Stenotrophomonas maltophilia]|uniref:CfaE/CblD family pilus tip adhesin n=1 Tax=Stenotrophomonas maltophilia TaxID=40324 RepID=UPI0031B94F02|nr:pilin protein [Stenotrophomonas maltophilia]